jgi:hypothetical protein
MGSKLKHSALLTLGAILGVAVTMQFSALAQKPVADGIPLDSLRQLASVYSLIKSTYVEPVEDRKLLTHAMSGMVDALDPHSAYLDKKAYRELREGTEGKFRRPRHRDRPERRGLRENRRPDRGFAGLARRHQGGRPDCPHRRRRGEGHGARRGDQAHARRAAHQSRADHPARGRPGAAGDHGRARRDRAEEREGQDRGARLCLGARLAVPGTDRERPGRQTGRPGARGTGLERPGAGPAQRPGRPAAGRDRHRRRLPARAAPRSSRPTASSRNRRRASTAAPSTTCSAAARIR